MQRVRVILLVFHLAFALLTSAVSPAQEYIYKQYNPKDGLGSATVYQMLQDKDGFIWIATNAGVSRFDGKHFRNFTTLDGLPENDVLRIFEDSRGRIWLAPFRNTLCYYYKGKIYNQQNDSLLRKIELVDFVRDVVENKNKELLLTDSKKIYHIDSQDNVKLIGRDIVKTGLATLGSVRESGEFNVRVAKKLFFTDGKTFTHWQDITDETALQHLVLQDKMICWLGLDTLHVQSSYYNKSYTQFIGPVNTMYLLSDSILCLNTNRGTIFYNLLQQKIVQRFLPNGNVSYFIFDKEGGYWFATLNDGLFRLSSPAFKSIVGRTAAGQKLGAYHLERCNNEIWAGCDMGHLLKIENQAATLVELTVNGKGFGSHLVYSLAAKENRLAAASGNYIFVKGRDDRFTPQIGSGSNKDVAWKSDHELMVASSESLYTMELNGTAEDAVHKTGRATSVYYRNDSTWFGTFDGLYLMTPASGVSYLGKDTALFRAPVISIRAGPDGTIWVATDGKGLVGLQHNKVAWHFGVHNGLTSDKVRCMGVDSGYVWVGTDKELNKISLQPQPVFTRYSYSDEFNGDIVNSILVVKDIVYVGTNTGVTWFDKRASFSSSMCNLKLLTVALNGEEKELQQSYFLPYRNNNIRFDYVAISMKSAGSIVYHYRLNGLDTTWKSTTQTSLELISLPPGTYKLEMFAVNRFDVKSPVYTVNIVVQTPFWRSTWFMVTAILLTALTAWFIGTRHNRAIIRKEKLRRLAEQQLLDLEQKALRTQMNPHFIFNCLHSIQSFILDEDAENANKYLSRFASLIRQTLENSLQSSISLADEIKYLATYLQLEQMRSPSGFEYRIETAADLSPETVSIPVMVLQPFVENAVRHGVQAVNGREALINIYFSINNHELVCRIEDNGIGRQRASLQKNSAPGTHRSLGMQLTYERIELINTSSEKKITVEIVDKVNEANEPYGTDVIIRFPNF